MQNSMQAALRKTLKPLILPLFKVHDGTKCIHTGTCQKGGKVFPSKLGDKGDKGVRFTKTHNHTQLTEDGRHVIFGLNDRVQVVQK